MSAASALAEAQAHGLTLLQAQTEKLTRLRPQSQAAALACPDCFTMQDMRQQMLTNTKFLWKMHGKPIIPDESDIIIDRRLDPDTDNTYRGWVVVHMSNTGEPAEFIEGPVSTR